MQEDMQLALGLVALHVQGVRHGLALAGRCRERLALDRFNDDTVAQHVLRDMISPHLTQRALQGGVVPETFLQHPFAIEKGAGRRDRDEHEHREASPKEAMRSRWRGSPVASRQKTAVDLKRRVKRSRDE